MEDKSSPSRRGNAPAPETPRPDVVAIVAMDGPALRQHLHQKFARSLSVPDLEHVFWTAIERAWQYGDSFDATKGGIEPWIRAIADNIARDLIRTNSSSREVFLDPSTMAALLESHRFADRVGAPSFQPPGDHAGETVDDGSTDRAQRHREWLRRLRAALAKLPQTQQRILLADAASESGRVSSRELATRFARAPSTIRSDRRRGIEHLRKQMTQAMERERERERESNNSVFMYTATGRSISKREKSPT